MKYKQKRSKCLANFKHQLSWAKKLQNRDQFHQVPQNCDQFHLVSPTWQHMEEIGCATSRFFANFGFVFTVLLATVFFGASCMLLQCLALLYGGT